MSCTHIVESAVVNDEGCSLQGVKCGLRVVEVPLVYDICVLDCGTDISVEIRYREHILDPGRHLND